LDAEGSSRPPAATGSRVVPWLLTDLAALAFGGRLRTRALQVFLVVVAEMRIVIHVARMAVIVVSDIATRRRWRRRRRQRIWRASAKLLEFEAVPAEKAPILVALSHILAEHS